MPILLERTKPRTRTPRTFVDNLGSFGSALALVDRDGRHLSYTDLLARVDRFTDALGTTRRLVFVEATNSADAIAAYVACLRGRHPVYLYNSHDRLKLDGLFDRYSPNAIVSSEAQGSELSWIHQGTLDLHPDLAVLLSTSGSTGSPKLVKLSHRNLESNARAIAAYLALDASERAITTLPFNYSYGMSVVNSHFSCGGALVLTEDSVTDRAFWQTFQAAGATSFAGVPHTFESLYQSRFSLRELKTLRYATQAGGRLDPSLVSHFGRLAAAHGWRFVVMYGQTEAAPRIAYLPPGHAVTHPSCIGVPVPGGRIDLLDEHGREITAADSPGQLAYSGPNVMMGYAERAADLATDETPRRLMTGDVACRNAQGLFYITGRLNRFVKPFGVRVNLDDLESALQPALPGARCAGNDQRIVVAVGEPFTDTGAVAVSTLARAVNLPEFTFRFVVLPQVPLLAGGKVDYVSILAAGSSAGVREKSRRFDVTTAMRLVFSARFARQFAIEFADMLGVRGREWRGVGHIYETLLSTEGVQESDTFQTLAGDSLSFVQVAAALTDYLGALPADWPERSVRELDLMRPMTHGSIA